MCTGQPQPQQQLTGNQCGGLHSQGCGSCRTFGGLDFSEHNIAGLLSLDCMDIKWYSFAFGSQCLECQESKLGEHATF